MSQPLEGAEVVSAMHLRTAYYALFGQTIDAVDIMELHALKYLVMGDLGYFHSTEHGTILLKLTLGDFILFTYMFRC